MKNSVKIGLGVAVVLAIITVVVIVSATSDTPNSTSDTSGTTSDNSSTATAMAKPTHVADPGYGNRERGWYDAFGTGFKDTYCRHVGDEPNIRFMCVTREKEYVSTNISPTAAHDTSSLPAKGSVRSFPSESYALIKRSKRTVWGNERNIVIIAILLGLAYNKGWFKV